MPPAGSPSVCPSVWVCTHILQCPHFLTRCVRGQDSRVADVTPKVQASVWTFPKWVFLTQLQREQASVLGETTETLFSPHPGPSPHPHQATGSSGDHVCLMPRREKHMRVLGGRGHAAGKWNVSPLTMTSRAHGEGLALHRPWDFPVLFPAQHQTGRKTQPVD